MQRPSIAALFILLAVASGCGSPTRSQEPAAADGTAASSPQALVRAPGVGDPMPLFELPNHDGTKVALGEALAKGPVVLVLYRGHW